MQLKINRSTYELKKPQPQKTSVNYVADTDRTIFAHTDFLDWFTDSTADVACKKRVRFLLKRLLSNGVVRNKPVAGVGKGWLRATLTGTAGSHFYLWHTTHAQSIGKSLGLKDGEIAVRMVRNHNETSTEISLGDLSLDYEKLPLSLIEGDKEEVMYTQQQVEIAINQNEAVQLLLGHPGSGKTTSLWHAASHAPSKKTIYLTYSEKLAEEARSNFKVFDSGAKIDVMTYGELIHYLADDRDDEPDGLSPVEGARKIGELPAKMNLLTEWEGHFDELYADLHAHGVGQALPISFQGLSATDELCMSVKTYTDARTKDLGAKMALSASKVLEYLNKESLIGDLFPGPTRSRRLITDINEPPPSRLSDVGTILVDEVQDLTQIEALFLLNVVARIACSSGAMPRLFMAGDESQTVRPTDFKWAWLKNLLTEVFGSDLEIKETKLDENLRSPKLIGQFIEATQVQYQNFNKEDRPSGIISYTKNNETEVGRLIYCSLESENQLKELTELFSQIPRSCLVYPGFSVPQALTDGNVGLTSIETAEQVKGRDFDVVGLIDAGQRQEVLSDLYKDRETNKYVDVFGRTLADQYRVAASRSAEKLILIDCGHDYFEQVSQMGKARVSLEIEKVDFQELLKQLDVNLNQEDLVRSQIENIKTVIADDPGQALLYLRTLKKQYEALQRDLFVEEELKAEVLRTEGCVLAAVLLADVKLEQIQRAQLISESDQILNQVKNAVLFEVVFQLAKNSSSWSSDQTIGVMLSASEVFSRVERDLSEVNSAYRKKLTHWFDGMSKQDALVDDKQTFRVLNDADKFVKNLDKAFPYMGDQLERTRLKWAEQYLDKKKYDTSIKILEQLTQRDHKLEAKCYVEAGKPSLASKSFELAGDIEQAISCARQVPDIERALELALTSNSPSQKTLEWLNDVKALFENKVVRGAGELTKEEGKTLLDWATKSFSKAQDQKNKGK